MYLATNCSTVVVGGLLIRFGAGRRITVHRSDDMEVLRSLNGSNCIKLARGKQDNLATGGC
jgi:hypothetical protein